MGFATEPIARGVTSSAHRLVNRPTALRRAWGWAVRRAVPTRVGGYDLDRGLGGRLLVHLGRDRVRLLPGRITVLMPFQAKL